MEAARSPADPAPSPTHPPPVLSVGREAAAAGNPPWDVPREEGPRLPYRVTPTGDHAHWSHAQSDHTHGRPRPRENTPIWGHAHGVKPREVQCSRVRGAVPLEHQLCALRGAVRLSRPPLPCLDTGSARL